MELIHLDHFVNIHKGEKMIIVGRGPTTFDYQELIGYPHPVIFINDAVALENNTCQQSYFFAHDKPMSAWFGKIKSYPVLLISWKRGHIPIARGLTDLQSYRNLEKATIYYRAVHPEGLLYKSREEIGSIEKLYTNCGTIHAAIHFAWLCGVEELYFIGCDGRGHGRRNSYDRRLPNKSDTHGWCHKNIRIVQDQLCEKLNLKTTYLGTPKHTKTYTPTLERPKNT